MDERISRVTRMETLYNEITRELEQSQALSDGGKAKLQELTSYYESPLWLQDRDADERGQLPKTLPRGILAEDTIWNLLCGTAELEV